MDTLKEYHREESQLKSLQVKNSALSMKCEDLRQKNIWITKSRDNLKAKHKSKVKAVVELLVDGFLNINDQEVADRLFVDITCIKNMKATIKRERK